jgi:hypothetical protein
VVNGRFEEATNVNRAILAFRSVAGILFLAQLVLGILFWTGRALGLVQLHMMLGGLFVVALVTVAILCARAGAPRGLVYLLLAWAVITPVVGFMQMQWMPGQFHWAIRVLHLLIGFGAMATLGRLVMSVSKGVKSPSVTPMPKLSHQGG